MTQLFENDKELLGQVYSGPSIFFIKKLLVIPNRIRPTRYVGGIVANHPLTIALQKIMDADQMVASC